MEDGRSFGDGNRMRGSRPNEVEVNEEKSSRAGHGMQKGTRGYIQNEKRKKPRGRGKRLLPPLLLPHCQWWIVPVSLYRIHDRMSTRPLPEFPIRLVLEPGIDTHLLLGGICREGPHGCAPACHLLYHGILTV